MTLRETLQGALAPVVRNFAVELGDTLSVARVALTYKPDNSPIRALTVVDGLAHVRGTLEEVSAEKAAEIWGEGSVATATLSLPSTIPILQGDIVAIETGHYSGQHFQIVARRYVEITQSHLLGLRSTPAAAIAGL